eukprot:jgi/Botrbrau1/642/Bobra.0161s0031.1
MSGPPGRLRREQHGALVPYRVVYDGQPLSQTMGQAGFSPYSLEREEEGLSASKLQTGYKKSAVELGISEAREVELSLLPREDIWSDAAIFPSLKQRVRKSLSAAQHAQEKRVRRERSNALDPAASPEPGSAPPDVPLLSFLPPEGAETWLQGLAGTTPLSVLARGVPNNLFRNQLFEELVTRLVPLPHAAWLIRVVYVNRFRGTQAGSHEAPDEATARSQAYTQHLTEYLEALLSDMVKGGFVGEGPSPPEAPETPADDPVPPGGPALPSAGTHASLGPRRPSLPPPGPADPGWVLIRLDGLCGQQDADSWRYIVQLLGYTRREGLLDAGGAAAWLMRMLQSRDPREILMSAALLPLFQILLPDITGSQQLVRTTAEICAKRCNPEGAAVSQGTMGPVYRLIQQGYSQILRALLFAIPATFISLDPALSRAAQCAPSSVPATPWDPVGSAAGERSGRSAVLRARGHHSSGALGAPEGARQPGKAPASGGSGDRAVPQGTVGAQRPFGAQAPHDSADWLARRVAEAVQQRTASLASSVQARVLHFKEFSVMQNLDQAMAVGDACAGLRDLRGALGAVRDETSEVVRLICDWAVDVPLDVVAQPGTRSPGTPPAEDLHGRYLRQTFALLLLREVAKAGPQQAHAPAEEPEVPDREVPEEGLREPPPLHLPIYKWLNGRASWETDLGGSASRTATAELLIRLALSSHFCPLNYLQTLIAEGVQARTKASEKASGGRAGEELHRYLLRQLHPQLRLPTMTSGPRHMGPHGGPHATGSAIDLASRAATPGDHARPDPAHHTAAPPTGPAGTGAHAAAIPWRAHVGLGLPEQATRWSPLRRQYAGCRRVLLDGLGEAGGAVTWVAESGAGLPRKRRRREGASRSSGPGVPGAGPFGPSTPGFPQEAEVPPSGPGPPAQPGGESHAVSAAEAESVPGKPVRLRKVLQMVGQALGFPLVAGTRQETGGDLLERSAEESGLGSAAALGSLSAEKMPALLSLVQRLWPWEKFLLGAQLERAVRAEFGAALNPEEVFGGGPGHARPPSEGLGGPEETAMTAVALLEASGSVGLAAELLMGFLRGLLRHRAQSILASQGGGHATDTVGMGEEDGGPIRELTLLAALTGRSDILAASGHLEAALKAATGWAFTNRSLTAPLAAVPFAESIHFATCLLNRFRVNSAVAGWWARVDKYTQSTGSRRELAQNWNAVGDHVPGTALRPPGLPVPWGPPPCRRECSASLPILGPQRFPPRRSIAVAMPQSMTPSSKLHEALAVRPQRGISGERTNQPRPSVHIDGGVAGRIGRGAGRRRPGDPRGGGGLERGRFRAATGPRAAGCHVRQPPAPAQAMDLPQRGRHRNRNLHTRRPPPGELQGEAQRTLASEGSGQGLHCSQERGAAAHARGGPSTEPLGLGPRDWLPALLGPSPPETCHWGSSTPCRACSGCCPLTLSSPASALCCREAVSRQPGGRGGTWQYSWCGTSRCGRYSCRIPSASTFSGMGSIRAVQGPVPLLPRWPRSLAVPRSLMLQGLRCVAGGWGTGGSGGTVPGGERSSHCEALLGSSLARPSPTAFHLQWAPHSPFSWTSRSCSQC